jgi:hypothetical protein
VKDPVEQAVFVREFLFNLFENHLLSGLISTHEYYRYLSAIDDDTYLASISRRLFADSPEPVDLGPHGSFRIVYLREPDDGRFPFVQRVIRGDLPPRRDLTCFIGHRFLKNIEKSLRFNLVHLLEPHGIHLRWSGYDLSAQDVFEDIVSGIRNADLCIFDNLGTLNRPNVYIEIGIAHAFGVPMLVCEHRGRKRVPDTGSVPSDLRGLFRIQYQNYQDLCRQLYFGLPLFLKGHGLR